MTGIPALQEPWVPPDAFPTETFGPLAGIPYRVEADE